MGQVNYEWRNKPEVATIGGKTYKFKSQIERKYALYLQMLKDVGAIDDWEYEPKQFIFKERYRKKSVYTPDFLVKETHYGHHEESYHEVKTSVRQTDVRRFRLMAADYPKVRMVLVLPSGTKKVKEIINRDNAKKYVERIMYCDPEFRKFGIK